MARFKKGESGNKSGRPKQDPALREACQLLTAEAIEKLVYWMRADDPGAAIKAITIILERGHGKPEQSIEVTGKDGAALVQPVINLQIEKKAKE